MGHENLTIFGLIGLALSIWAIINVVQSGTSNMGKVLWILLLILVPFLGFIIWLVAGPRGSR